jgi:predicted phosphatase
MPRQRILSSVEQTAFDSPPVFTAADRKKFIRLSSGASDLLGSRQTSENRVCFLVTLAYFRATRRFYARQFLEQDIAYASALLGVRVKVNVRSVYTKDTYRRDRQAILNFTGFAPFDEQARQAVITHLQPLIRSNARPKLMFLQTLDFLERHKIEVPTASTLTTLILDEIRAHEQTLTSLIAQALTPESRALLDDLLEKEVPEGEESLRPLRRFRLTLLKTFSHSLKPSQLKRNVEDLETLGTLYSHLVSLLQALDLTPEGIQYYAHSVIKSEIFQVSRRADAHRYLHLICFAAHQYFRLHDLLIDALLAAVQNARNTSKRENQERYFEERRHHAQSVKSFIGDVERTMTTPLSSIESVVFRENLSDCEKVQRIQEILAERQNERHEFEGKLTQFKQHWQEAEGDGALFDVLEAKSVKLQNKVAGIIKHVTFQGTDSALMEAITHYQAKDGAVTHTAPTAFLEESEREALTDEEGKFRVPLYKALLFIRIADAIKSGVLNVERSYRYRSLDDYLISSVEWAANRDAYLEQADLTAAADCQPYLDTLLSALDRQYETTNRHILDGKNEDVSFHKDGSVIIHTPREEEEEAQPIGNFLPNGRYISLLEVLSTVERHTKFLDAFQHWQVKYTKERPADRSFYAGIIGYGCRLGIGKIAQTSNQISDSELENAVNWYFSLETVEGANDRILTLLDQLKLPQIYRRETDRLHTSSDGQKVPVTVDSLNANYSYKYFGQGKGVSPYTFIDERHFLWHGMVVSSADREAAYVIDGLMHNDVVKSDIHSTDTHGYTEVIFGVMRLLGFSYAPRIRSVKDQTLYSVKKRKEYEQLGFKVVVKSVRSAKQAETFSCRHRRSA